MTAKEQKKAAADFAAKWIGRGYEKGECQMMMETEKILHRRIDFLSLKRYGHIVRAMPQRIWFTHDWGWYPENVTQAQLVQR